MPFLHLWAGPGMELEGKKVLSPGSFPVLDSIFLRTNVMQWILWLVSSIT